MFIPIGDDNSYRTRTPFIVYAIVAANAYVWYLQLKNGEAFTAGYSAIPYELSSGIDLTIPKFINYHGERISIPQAAGPSPLYLTALTSMFMHGSWMHIIGNMVYLLIFGDQIEDRLGHLKFLIFYLLAGLGATVAQVAVNPVSIIPCVGASGAIAGVLGAYLILHPSNRVRVLVFRNIVILPASLVLGVWVAMQFLGHANSKVGDVGGVAYMAHIGGFVVGFVVSMFLRIKKR